MGRPLRRRGGDPGGRVLPQLPDPGGHRNLLGVPPGILKAIVWQDGFIIPPTAPGLGYELNDDLIARHRVAQA